MFFCLCLLDLVFGHRFRHAKSFDGTTSYHIPKLTKIQASSGLAVLGLGKLTLRCR